MAILVPTCCQEVPNLTPRSPKRAQLVAKIAQNTPQDPPSRPPKTPKCSQNANRPFFQRSLPRPPKMLKKAAQMTSRWPSWCQLGASWCHLGSNLGPPLAHLSEILVDPSPAKIDQNQPRQLLRDFSSQGRPQELPDPLQTPMFQVSRSIFQRFSSIFQNTFL